jgi:hypothetical protein
VIRRSASPGEVLGFAYVETWARRRAQQLAEQLGVAVVVLDELRRRLVVRIVPSPEAVARRRAGRVSETYTAGGQIAATFVTLKQRRTGEELFPPPALKPTLHPTDYVDPSLAFGTLEF